MEPSSEELSIWIPFGYQSRPLAELVDHVLRPVFHQQPPIRALRVTGFISGLEAAVVHWILGAPECAVTAKASKVIDNPLVSDQWLIELAVHSGREPGSLTIQQCVAEFAHVEIDAATWILNGTKTPFPPWDQCTDIRPVLHINLPKGADEEAVVRTLRSKSPWVSDSIEIHKPERKSD